MLKNRSRSIEPCELFIFSPNDDDDDDGIREGCDHGKNSLAISSTLSDGGNDKDEKSSKIVTVQHNFRLDRSNERNRVARRHKRCLPSSP